MKCELSLKKNERELRRNSSGIFTFYLLYGVYGIISRMKNWASNYILEWFLMLGLFGKYFGETRWTIYVF